MKILVVACVVLGVVAVSGCNGSNEPSKDASAEPTKITGESAKITDESNDRSADRLKVHVDLGGGAQMEMTLIPAGEFMMGSEESAEETAAFFKAKCAESIRDADVFIKEHPQHPVRITKPFYLGTYPVTRGQFRQFISETHHIMDSEKRMPSRTSGMDPSGAFGWDAEKMSLEFSDKYSWKDTGFEQTDEHPVVNVSWNDAVAFCKWLSKKAHKRYRLPTEAEWEYACRAGTTTRYNSGNDPETLATVGNVADLTLTSKFPNLKYNIKASDGYAFTAPVGRFSSNSFGLYDMHGNVKQWCNDHRSTEYYTTSPEDDPKGPAIGDRAYYRIVRGGSFIDLLYVDRSAFRSFEVEGSISIDLGFRVARTQ